jgi:signal transduction histidine kinase
VKTKIRTSGEVILNPVPPETDGVSPPGNGPVIQSQKIVKTGLMAAGIAHDFNNILAIISGYSEMLQEDVSGDPVLSEKVSRIQEAVSKARSVINQILMYGTRVGQEGILISVSEVLEETLAFLIPSLPQNILLKSHIPKKNSNVIADPGQLFRAFLNLINNAIQSLEGMGGTIKVTLAIVKGNSVNKKLKKHIIADEYVLVTFKDTGCGIESSQSGHLFEPFVTTHEAGKGTGLGLYITHEIITDIGGEIIVSGKKGRGTVIYVYLPVSSKYHGDANHTDHDAGLLDDE